MKKKNKKFIDDEEYLKERIETPQRSYYIKMTRNKYKNRIQPHGKLQKKKSIFESRKHNDPFLNVKSKATKNKKKKRKKYTKFVPRVLKNNKKKIYKNIVSNGKQVYTKELTNKALYKKNYTNENHFNQNLNCPVKNFENKTFKDQIKKPKKQLNGVKSNDVQNSATNKGKKLQKKNKNDNSKSLRNKCLRHNSEGNPNFQIKKNNKGNFRDYHSIPVHQQKIKKDPLITSLKLLSIISDYSMQKANKISPENSDVGAVIKFDTICQSASVISIESQKQKMKFNQNLFSMGSKLLNNLTNTIASSSKDNISELTQKSKISLDFKGEKNSKLNINFFSQVDNKIIEEESKDLLSMNNCLDRKISSETTQNCFLENTNTYESSDIFSPTVPSLFDEKKYFFGVQDDHRNEQRISNFTRVITSILANHLEKSFYHLKLFKKKRLQSSDNLDVNVDDYSDLRTKLMIKNIPNKYNILQLANLYNLEFRNQFDFLYLVIDPKTNCNQGYAFINMSPGTLKYEFFKRFNNTSWPNSRSGKKCEITYAKLQNKDPIDRIFIMKYFQECHKYWVPDHIILNKFPEIEMQLNSLQQRREYLLKSRQFSKLDFFPFYGNQFNQGPISYPNMSFSSYIPKHPMSTESKPKVLKNRSNLI
jgi:hypothetical protein